MIDTTVPGAREIQLLLRACLHYNSVCALIPYQALELLETHQVPGGVLHELWYANHAVRCHEERVTVPMGATQLQTMKDVSPVIAAVLE